MEPGMWLSHHHAEHYDRCVVVAGRHVCRRCLALYPVAIFVAVLQVAGVIGAGAGVWLMWLTPLPVVAEWVAEHVREAPYSPRRQAALSVVAAVGLGIALGRHARHPFEAASVVPVLVYTAVCIAAWSVSARRAMRNAPKRWQLAFERSEAERWERLHRAVVDQDGGATKSMSSSTAPTNDELKSL